MEKWRCLAPSINVDFGVGAIDRLPSIAAGKRVLLVTTEGFTRRGVTAQINAVLGDSIVAILDHVEPNPSLDAIDRQARILCKKDPNMIIGIGGGSVLDTAKLLSVSLAAPDEWSLSKHFRDGLEAPECRALPVVAVPTTAGTGAEVTPFATIWDHRAKRKYSFARDDMMPRIALLDPSLTLGVPHEVTISTGLDAVSQALESIWNRHSNAVSMAWSLHSLQLSLGSLPLLIEAPSDVLLRGKMLQASFLAGLAISLTRTAIAHSISYPITAHFGLPHGLACSFTLPAVLEFNAAADDGRLELLARCLCFDSIKDLRGALIDLLMRLNVRYFMEAHIAGLDRLMGCVPEMITPGRADNNLRSVSHDDIRGILERSYEFIH